MRRKPLSRLKKCLIDHITPVKEHMHAYRCTHTHTLSLSCHRHHHLSLAGYVSDTYPVTDTCYVLAFVLLLIYTCIERLHWSNNATWRDEDVKTPFGWSKHPEPTLKPSRRCWRADPGRHNSLYSTWRSMPPNAACIAGKAPTKTYPPSSFSPCSGKPIRVARIPATCAWRTGSTSGEAP
jgi:hypothetical protein